MPAVYTPPPGVVPGGPGSAPAPQPRDYAPPPQAEYLPAAGAVVPETPGPQAARPAVPRPNPIGALLPAGISTTMAAIYAGLAALSLVALVVGIFLYGSASKSDTARRVAAADRTMSQVVRDEARVGDKLKAAFEPEKGPESPTKTYNGDSVRQAIKDVQPDLDSAAKTVESDQSTMRTAITSMNDRGLISLTSGDQLDRKAAQMEAISRALDVRFEEVTTARQQLTLLGDLTTAQENFNGLASALEKQDLVTATSRYTPSNNAIKQAVADAQQPSTPDAVRNYVTEVSGFVDATQAVINSLQARDFGEYDASLRVFTTKLENLANYDPKTMRKQYDDVTKSYDDRYNSYIHDAGLVTGARAV